MNKIIALYSKLEEEGDRWFGDLPIMHKGRIMDRPTFWGTVHCRNLSEGFFDVIYKLKPCAPEGREAVAVELGSGNSASAAYLLENNWKLIFVDYSAQALEYLKKSVEIGSPQAKTAEYVVSKAEEYPWPYKVDLVMACDSLFYFDPRKITSLFAKIYAALNKGGIFIGTFFVNKSEEYDESSQIRGAWLLKDADEAKTLLTSQGFSVLQCEIKIKQDIPFVYFYAKKIEEVAQTTVGIQVNRFMSFKPKPDLAGYWFYIAKNTTSEVCYKQSAVDKLEKVEMKLGKNAYQNKAVHGWTPLHVAVLATNRAAINYFLSKGVDPKVTDDEGLSALDYATCYNPELLPLLK